MEILVRHPELLRGVQAEHGVPWEEQGRPGTNGLCCAMEACGCIAPTPGKETKIP